MKIENILILANKIASEFHEDWRKTRLNADGTYEPRWKKIKDEDFVEKLSKLSSLPKTIRKVDSSYEIDIANSSFDMLSPDWQEENYDAAHLVAMIIYCNELRELSISDIGEIIHHSWLERNSWAKGTELDVPFSELSPEEQAKDIRQYEIGKRVYAQMKAEAEDETL